MDSAQISWIQRKSHEFAQISWSILRQGPRTHRASTAHAQTMRIGSNMRQIAPHLRTPPPAIPRTQDELCRIGSELPGIHRTAQIGREHIDFRERRAKCRARAAQTM